MSPPFQFGLMPLTRRTGSCDWDFTRISIYEKNFTKMISGWKEDFTRIISSCKKDFATMISSCKRGFTRRIDTCGKYRINKEVGSKITEREWCSFGIFYSTLVIFFQPLCPLLGSRWLQKSRGYLPFGGWPSDHSVCVLQTDQKLLCSKQENETKYSANHTVTTSYPCVS